MSEIATISVQQLAKLGSQESVEVIDVRTPAEFRELHATIAGRNIPLDTLDPKKVMSSRSGTDDQTLYLICRSGNRSGKACAQFIEAGFENIVNVAGGTLAWDGAGLPVVRGKPAMSLERQVRIAAGFLVLLGAALSLINVWFALLSGFIGAGLMFSGITDTCGMGMVLARMPWNRT